MLRQAWRVIRRADSIIIASDGLSDPFEDDDDVFVPRGHLLQVCIEAPLAAFDGAPVQASWLFDVIYQVSQNVADHGSIDLLLQRHGSVSMALDVRQPVSKTKTNRWRAAGPGRGHASPVVRHAVWRSDAADRHRAAAGGTGAHRRSGGQGAVATRRHCPLASSFDGGWCQLSVPPYLAALAIFE